MQELQTMQLRQSLASPDSKSTAEAASEGGGLFGIGGVQVSDAEKATLTEISNALGS